MRWTGIFSRTRTRNNPRLAMVLMPPEPSTIATLGFRCPPALSFSCIPSAAHEYIEIIGLSGQRHQRPGAGPWFRTLAGPQDAGGAARSVTLPHLDALAAG